jgi:hypothetical protein
VTVPDINTVWARISANAGSEFRMIKGETFRYAIVSAHIALDRTNHQIAKSHVEKALAFVPLKNTRVIAHLRAPAYLYAIVMDDRIRQIDW